MGTYAGIDISDDVKNFSITNLKTGPAVGFGATHSFGILIGKNCDNYRVIGNDVSGNFIGGVQDLSIGTSI